MNSQKRNDCIQDCIHYIWNSFHEIVLQKQYCTTFSPIHKLVYICIYVCMCIYFYAIFIRYVLVVFQCDLICTSLMMNGMAHFCMYLTQHYLYLCLSLYKNIYFFGVVAVQILCSFFYWVVGFLTAWRSKILLLKIK